MDELPQKFEALASNIGLLDRQAGDLPPGRARRARCRPGLLRLECRSRAGAEEADGPELCGLLRTRRERSRATGAPPSSALNSRGFN